MYNMVSLSGMKLLTLGEKYILILSVKKKRYKFRSLHYISCGMKLTPYVQVCRDGCILVIAHIRLSKLTMRHIIDTMRHNLHLH